MLDAELLDLVFEAIKHTNRFVRETGYYVCGQFVVILNEDKIGDTSVVSDWPYCVALCSPRSVAAKRRAAPIGKSSSSPSKTPQGMPFDEFADRMSSQLAIGLADNWSQVRAPRGVFTSCRVILLHAGLAFKNLGAHGGLGRNA